MNSRVYNGEGNVAFKERVKAEGRWREFTDFRSLLKTRLRSERPDLDEEEFRQITWLQCRQAFPPTGAENVEPEEIRKALNTADHEPGSKSDFEKGLVAVKGREKPSSAKAALLAAGGASDTVGGVQDDVEWVYQHLDIPWSDIDAEGVPSRGAVGLLATAKTDPAWFYQTYHAKLLPTKSQVEAEGWFRGDEGRIEEMVKLVVDDRELKKLREAVGGE